MAANSSETSSQLAWDKDLQVVPCVDPWGRPGAYSTLRLEGNPLLPLFLEAHLDRLADSLNRLKLVSPIDLRIVGEEIQSFATACAAESPCLLRVSVLEDRFQLEARPLPPMGAWMEGRLLPYVRNNPEAKSLDHQLFEEVGKLNRSSEEALLLAPDGELGEGATSNLIFVQGEILVAPESNVLPGITLAKLLPELAKQFTVDRRPVHLTDLPGFTEILATGSGKEVVGFARIAEVGWRARAETILDKARNLYGEIKNNYFASLDA